MKKLRDEFMAFLQKEDKKGCFEFVDGKLSSGEMKVLTMYTDIIAPSLSEWECDYESDPLCIWREHVRSEIVRGLIEFCFPYVLRERKENNGLTMAIVCPQEEEHEIGARIASDIFTLAGFETTFVGRETPLETFLLAVKTYDFDFVSIGVTNYYNLIHVRKMIERIKALNSRTRIVVGGRAFDSKREYFREIGADHYIPDFKGIMVFSGGIK